MYYSKICPRLEFSKQVAANNERLRINEAWAMMGQTTLEYW
jgi:hypothetical protein